MNIGETTLSFLQEDCVREFGEKDGERLFRLAEQEYQKLLCAADYRNSGAVREHLQKKLFPPMAYYKALCAAGYAKEAALDCVRKETRKAAQAKRDEMRGLAQMPFAYSIYRMGVKKHMKKNFPDAGWESAAMAARSISTSAAAFIGISRGSTAVRNCAASTVKTTRSHFRAFCRRSGSSAPARSAAAQHAVTFTSSRLEAAGIKAGWIF